MKKNDLINLNFFLFGCCGRCFVLRFIDFLFLVYLLFNSFMFLLLIVFNIII